MTYASLPIDAVGARVTPVQPVPPSTRVAARSDGSGTPAHRGREGHGQAAPHAAPATQLSAGSLRAQAVTGLLEARRTDLVGADRALTPPGRKAMESLATVWPPEEKPRPRADGTVDPGLVGPDEDSKAEEASRRRAQRAAERMAAQIEDEAAQALAARLDAQDVELARATARATEAARVREAGGDQAPGADRDPGVHPAASADRARTAAGEAGDGSNRTPEIAAAQEALAHLAVAVADVSRTVRAGIGKAVGEANDLAARIAETNARIVSAARDGQAPAGLTRSRDALVGALARLTGATAQPGAGAAVDVLVDGRAMVSGDAISPLAVGPRSAESAQARVVWADGRDVSLSSGVLASRLGTLNRTLPGVMDAVQSVVERLSAQSAAGQGGPVPGGPQSMAALADQLGELARSADSSAAYAQVAGAVGDLVGRLELGDVPPDVRGSSMLLGAVTEATPRAPSLDIAPLRRALVALGQAAAGIGDGGAGAAATLVSGAPALATPQAAPDAPSALASVRVLSVATAGSAVSAQTFRTDERLGDGRQRQIGVVQQADSPAATTTLIDVGTFPTINDVASAINNAALDVRATIAHLGAGAVQLHIMSLKTGKETSVTITDGAEPPASSTIIGRLTRLTAGRDSHIEVQAARHQTRTVVSSERTIPDVLPGVGLALHAADPERSFSIGVIRHTDRAVERVADLVGGAAAVVTAARAAGSPTVADQVLSALGLASGDEGHYGVPGVRLDRRGLPSVDRGDLAQAYAAQPTATRAAVAAAAQSLSSIASRTDDATWEAYVNARGSMGLGLTTYAPPSAQRPDHSDGTASALQRQENALQAVLVRLQEQGTWLDGQVRR